MMAGIYVSPAGAEDESLSGDTVFLQIEESVTEAVFREVSTAFQINTNRHCFRE